LQATARYLRQGKEFWANVRTVTEQIGYSEGGRILVPSSIDEVCNALEELGLSCDHLRDGQTLTTLGRDILEYLRYRADAIESHVFQHLMGDTEAKTAFEELQRRRPQSRCHIPRNNQKLAEDGPAFLTGIVNLIIEENSQGLPCDYNPQTLTSVTHGRKPFRTLSRRVDGAFPSTINPIAIWEIKEYYYTSSFGSRIADGVFVTMLDGIELKEVQESRVQLDANSKKVHHLLMVDGRGSWRENSSGPAYLCRIIDMLNMGLVDDVLVGREVLTELPGIVSRWVRLALSDNERLESALRVGLERVEHLINQGNSASYYKAASTLLGVRTLFTSLGKAAEWTRYQGEIRGTHSRKKKLIESLAEAGL
jgi:hypothetical protein